MAAVLAALGGACAAPADDTEVPGFAAVEVQGDTRLTACPRGADGYLRGELWGDLEGEVAWDAAALLCDGMERPGERGVRLAFAHADTDGALLVVIGLAGRPEALEGSETPATLTLVDGQRGRFYSSGERERCWARIERVTARADDAGFDVDGLVFCTGTLPEVNGPGAVTPGEFAFAGVVRPEPA